jgi:hypothetical protein
LLQLSLLTNVIAGDGILESLFLHPEDNTMWTSVVMFAISGMQVSAAAKNEPGWHREYGEARQQGRRLERPLAVFIGSGKQGWDQISKEGRLPEDARRVLTEKYVCVYVNTEDKRGQELASAFEIPDGPAIVISTVSGQYQAFRHEGQLEDQALTRHLSRYADSNREIRFTETNPSRRVSYYQPVEVSAPARVSFGRSC